MISVSDDFKQAMQAPVKVLRAELVAGDKTISSDGDLASFKIEASGEWLKTAMRKISGKLIIADYNLVENAGEWLTASIGVRLPSGEWSDLSFGSFLITEQIVDKEKGTMTFAGYDKMILAYTAYDPSAHTFPCLLAEFTQQICSKIGVENGMSEMGFFNADLEIPVDYYANISGITYRDILTQIAEATLATAIIGADDKLYLRPITATGETLDNNHLKKLKLEPKFGEVNALVLARLPQEDNIAHRDEESITAHGLTEIKIANNEILDKRREDLIGGMFGGISGIAFTPFDLNTEGHGWYEVGDKVSVENAGIVYDCAIFNYILEVGNGFKERLFTKAITKTATNYKRTGDTTRHLYNTEILVDKQQRFIESLVSDMYDESGLINQSFTDIHQDISSVITSVQNSGGSNLIRNSVGYAKDGDGLPAEWTAEIGGSLLIQPSAEAVAHGSLSGNIIALTNATITQRVNVKVDDPNTLEDNKTYYSFSVKVKKGVVGDGQITISNSVENYELSFATGDDPYFDTYEIAKLLPKENYYDITIHGGEEGDFTVTDAMLAVGQYKSQWQQANGEFMNTQVNINKDGVEIRSSTYLGTFTLQTPLGFAGFSGNNRVFSLDIDGISAPKASFRDEINMPPIKVVAMDDGWAFVPMIAEGQ